MLLYALGTAACAVATNIWMLIAFRDRRQPGHRRRMGGGRGDGRRGRARRNGASRRARCCTRRRPMGLFLATFVNFQIAGVLLHGSPETSWRYVFLFGLVPAAVAFIVRLFVKEPERWKRRPPARARTRASPSCSRPSTGASTLGGFAMAVIALITWWSVQRLHPDRVDRPGAGDGPAPTGWTGPRRWRWSRAGSSSRPTCFNLGGLHRHAADDPGGEDARAAARCSASTSRCRPSR